MLAEAVRAVLALALFCLALSHVPLFGAGDGARAAGTDSSYCGTAPAGTPGHLPCEACRIGAGADLPPPCATIVPVRFELAVQAARPRVAVSDTATTWVRPESRAPPRV
jgi:hypothetical protein